MRKFIDVNWRLFDHHCLVTYVWVSLSSNPKLTSNAMWLSIIMDCGKGSKSVAYLQEIQSYVLKSQDFVT